LRTEKAGIWKVGRRWDGERIGRWEGEKMGRWEGRGVGMSRPAAL